MKKYRYYGEEVSEYGNENGYVDYSTFAKALDRAGGFILCNNIVNVIPIESFYESLVKCGIPYSIDDDGNECYEGDEGYDEDDIYDYEYPDIFQWYLVADNSWSRDILEQANQVYGYIEELDLLVWGVTHWGTSWDYVLTNIKLSEDTHGVYVIEDEEE